jgi:hypothetical protein
MKPGTLVILAALVGCKDKVDVEPLPTEGRVHHWEGVGALGEPARALAVLSDGTILAAGDSGLHRSVDGASWSAVDASGLGSGVVTSLHAAGDAAVVAWVHGDGLYRSADSGASWAPVSGPPRQPLMSAFNPRGLVVPFGSDVDDQGRLWLAGVGGLFTSDDGGDSLTLVDTADAGGINVLFSDVAVDGEQIFAVSQLANSVLPSSYQGLLTGVAFYSDDGGASWELLDDGLDVIAPMGAAFHDGDPCLAAMDGGVFCRQDGAWVSLGGPPDAIGLVSIDGGLSTASATRGPWRLDQDTWSSVEGGPIAAIDGTLALGTAGDVFSLAEGDGALPPDASGSGTVYVALSFHTNLYHSYRGDTNDDDGYGQDIRVIRTALDWLDAHPDVHAEWDIENHFSLDGWLATEAPDIIERIQDRVDDGRDDVRLMSWNNGAMASSTEEEFRASVQRAQDSYAAVFSEQVPGVQPQECMFTPDHIGWYTDEGVDWVTLFYAANGFTALREDVTLEGAELYNPITIRDPDLGDEMVWVPAYHHADVLEHGGLSAWTRQIGAQVDGDALLLVHFDADAESWENFGAELTRLADQVAAGEVVYTNIQDYLDSHPPISSVDVAGDVADGTGDGFQSWAEKDFNHRLATQIVAAREHADHARALGGGDGAVEALLADALQPRMLALSTTHFGLAAPYLADDRVEAAWAYAAVALQPLSPGQIHVLNHRDSTGEALIELDLPVPAEQWLGADRLAVYGADGAELPILVGEATIEGERLMVPVSFVLGVDAGASTWLTWSAAADGARAVGSVGGRELAVPGLYGALTECDGAQWSAEMSAGAASADARSVRASATGDAALELCGAVGSVEQRYHAYDGLPGVVVEVEAAIPEVDDPEDAESVALSLFQCSGHAETVRWRAFSGRERARPMRRDVETWNGQSVDGWMAIDCADGLTLEISHRVTERSSLALAPLRDQAGVTWAAPLGTLWGDSPWHDARQTGGSGMGDVVTALVGSQYRPAAPDWSGQTVRYRLLVGDGTIGAGTLDLFAHPPLVRAL